MHNIDEYIKYLEESSIIDFSICFEMAEMCSAKIDSDPAFSRRLCINVLNNWAKIPEGCRIIWYSIIEALGFYPYIQKEQIKLDSLSEEMRYGMSESHFLSGKFHHDEQRRIISKIFESKNIIVSAPTSFGKSLLIEEIVASLKYKNVVIIQPTLALLDETRKKLSKYSGKYKIIVRTTQEPSKTKSNIFLFTAERVCEYLHFENIDFIIIDEFYKLSGGRDDERSSALNNAFYKLLKLYNPQFYLLGPNIDKISEGFAKKYNAIFYKSNYSLVDSKVVDIYNSISDESRNNREKKLFELLTSLSKEQTIIYCSSPDRVRSLSKKFYNYIRENKKSEEVINLPIIEWITENLSAKWSINNILKCGIGIHDAALPKHITTSIIDYFNSNKLKYLFCTSTIIEGVNTSAKNVIYYDAKKGHNIPIDYFDYSNIKGRAGRMMVHYIGNIYNFNVPPEKVEINVDIPFFQQNPIKDEVLIQLDENDVNNKQSNQYLEIKTISDKEKEVIRRNGLSVKGQLHILNQLRSDIHSKANFICWNGTKPKKVYLDYILKLAWDNLLSESESKTITFNQLAYLTHAYGVWETPIKKLIEDNVKYKINKYKASHPNDEIAEQTLIGYEDQSIKLILQVVRHWFEYKVPKFLSTIDSLQEIVCNEIGIQPGDYSQFASIIENGFIPIHLTLLAEYGIPHSAIIKISKFIPTDIDDENLILYIKDHNLHLIKSLIKYEQDKLINLFT